MKNRLLQMAFVAAVVATSQTDAHANGYKILGVKSAKASGMGEAFAVQADDPSAVAINPAGLAQIRGTDINIQGTICNAYSRHTAPSGDVTHNEDGWQMVPAFYVASDFGMENVTFGLGVSLPNGLSGEWANDSFARYVTTYSSLTVADISPAVAVKVGKRLLIGGAVDFYHSRAQLDKMLDAGLAYGAPGMMDMKSSLEGSGNAWGFNAGAIYSISPSHSVATVYRHGFTIDYDGTLSVDAAGIRSDIAARVDFPRVIVAGYAYRPSDRLKLEFNADWTDWRSVGDIVVRFKDGATPDISQAQDLRNTVAYKFGVEYRLSDDLTFRGGYIYNQNATAEQTWRPNLPDTPVHFLTAGLGYRIGHFTLDGAIQLLLYETRSIDNNVDNNELVSSSSVDGTYRTFAPCMSLSATHRF